MQEVNSYFQLHNLFLKVALSNVKYRMKYRLAYIFSPQCQANLSNWFTKFGNYFQHFVEPI